MLDSDAADEILSVRIPIDLKREIAKDVGKRGQTLKSWIMRAARARLDRNELPIAGREDGG